MVAIASRRNVVEEAVAALRRQADLINDHLPCQVTIHLPPADGRDGVVLEVNIKVRESRACG